MVRFNIFYVTGKYNLEVEANEKIRASRLPQYAAAVMANLAALAFGSILAWTSPAAPHLLNSSEPYSVDTHQMSLIGSLMPIGAASASVPTGYLTDRVGRKVTLLGLVPLCVVGWGLIIWAVNVEMVYAGRFITGMCSGAVCVVCPVYTSEVSQKEIRGELVSYFQLMVAAGVMLTFILGSQLSVFYLSIACGVVPIAFGAGFSFFPETPVYYLTKERPEDAERSLKFFRGDRYDTNRELRELLESVEKRPSSVEADSAWRVFLSKHGLRASFMSVALMAFQQLCGINATTFYSTIIFQDSGSSIEPKYATIVIGFMQFAATLVAMFLTDRVGRVLLLGASAAAMAVSMFAMGAYFYLKEGDFDVSNFSWLPLLSLCVFTLMFSVGYGPVPWSLMPEITPPRIVGTVTSVACVVSWVCAFLVTKFFPELVDLMGAGVTFWIFAAIGVCAAVFSFRGLPETKGKSLDAIRLEMSR